MMYQIFVNHRRRGGQGDAGPQAVLWIGLGALVLIWVAPVVELFADNPNNFRQLWGFFTVSHPKPGWGQVFRTAGDALTVLPFGNRDYVLSLNRTPVELVIGIGLTAAALGAAWMLSRRRGRPFARRLAEASVAVAVIGVASLGQSDGPAYLYFALWLSIVPLGAALAVLAAMPARAVSSRRTISLGWAAAVALCACTVSYGIVLSPVNRTVGSGPWPPWDAVTTQGRLRTVADTASLDRVAVAAVHAGDRSVVITIGAPSVWPLAGGVALALTERDIKVAVAPHQWVSYFGANATVPSVESLCFDLYPAAGIAPAHALTVVDGTALAYCARAN